MTEDQILAKFHDTYVQRYDMAPVTARKTINEQIEKIKNQDLDYLVDKLNFKNPCLLKMFSMLTNIPTKTEAQIAEALPKLADTKQLWQTCLGKGFMPRKNGNTWCFAKDSGETIKIPDRKTYRQCVADTIRKEILEKL